MLHELCTNHLWFMYLAMGLISLAVGSLLNVVIYRVPLMLEREWKQNCCAMLHLECVQEPAVNLFFPRSFCPHCKTMIKAWQNIPLLSYLFLRRRCAHCKTIISARYPLIELSTLLLSLYACWHFGFTLELAFALPALWLLICLFFIDLDHQLLPDSLTYSLLWLGLIANTLHLFTSLSDAVLSAAAAYIILWGFIKLFYLITGKIGMGNGDFKLFSAFGAWFGWKFLPLILLFSSIIGTIVGLFYLYVTDKDKDTTIPFGPFLCVAGLITLFWGQQIITFYIKMWF